MTKINPILDAMSEIDDNIITNTNHSKRPKKLPIVIAVAAALMLLMGAAVISISEVTINNKHLIDYNFTVQENVNTEPRRELLEMGATSQAFSMGQSYELTALPSEVFELLNLHPLMNDNFTEKESKVHITLLKFGNPIEFGQLEMIYSLTDKETDVEMLFQIRCKLVEETEASSDYQNLKEYKLLELNDGSKALIYGHAIMEGEGFWHGTFSYGGIIYDFSTSYTDYDSFIQTLTDLGVL